MGKNKLSKFAEMETFPHVFQYPFSVLQKQNFPLKGKWHTHFFNNNNPIILELGCGKGEYTVELAKQFPDKNFIGIDIKGARMWTGAKAVEEKQMTNVAFLRTHIECILHFFASGEVSEIWITFPDPQMNKTNKRLTSPRFLSMYTQIMPTNGIIHLKTDSPFLHSYTHQLVQANSLPIRHHSVDLYNDPKWLSNPILNIRTYYEKQWIARGLSIKYLSFECVPKETWIEPDEENIEKDTYRSFGRQSRSELISG